MNFPSTNEFDANNLEFEVIFDEAIEPESESAAKPTKAILVIIPRGIEFRIDEGSVPGATCVRIPVGGTA